jgi:hypothetical protein
VGGMRLNRKPCPRCGRDVAWRSVRAPRVNRRRPIPALQVPVRHKPREDYQGAVRAVGGSFFCLAGEAR